MTKNKDYKDATRLAHLGLAADEYFGIVNPPIARASTILYPSLAAYEDPNHKYRYGRMGNPLSEKFETAIADIENGFNGCSTASGLSAITLALTTILKAGDHALVVDTLYPPARDFCNQVLAKFGVEIEYYDPRIAGGIKDLVKDNTALIYLESPGSGTFEVQDVPAIVNVAKANNIKTVIDNTYAAGLIFKPLNHGVDYSLQSATKYIGGHSDINMGIVIAKSQSDYKAMKTTALNRGDCASAEDLYLGLRGLRTISLRMKQNADNAMKVATWLSHQSGIAEILYPALETSPDYELWKRDFTGANGILSIVMQPSAKQAVHAFVDALDLFPIGSSWGGYESLLQPQYLKKYRTINQRPADEGAVLRLQIGLEDADDLIADLDQALKIFNKEK
ncbi:MAG: cystathionine beta-lyase [Bdellovibrionales bacterium]